jgi:hypothetical protein
VIREVGVAERWRDRGRRRRGTIAQGARGGEGARVARAARRRVAPHAGGRPMGLDSLSLCMTLLAFMPRATPRLLTTEPRRGSAGEA